jgi:hypothetical protein
MSEFEYKDLLVKDGGKLRVAEALALAEKSMDAFEKKIREIKLKELYDLVDDLRYLNNPRVFNVAYKVLREKSVRWYEYMKSSEKKRKHIDPNFFSERLSAYDGTGFELFNYKSREFDERPPNEIFKDLIQKISGWEK